MWLSFALTTAVFWAIGSVLIKKSTIDLHNSVIYFLNASFYLVGWLIYWLLNGQFIWDPMAVIISILPGLGFIYVLTAFSRAEISLVTSIGSIHAVITALLAVIFLGVILNLPQVGLIVAVIGGVIIMSWPEKIKTSKTAWLQWGIGYGLLAGTINFLIKLAIDRVNPVSFSLTTALWQMLVALIWLSFSRQRQALKTLKSKQGQVGLMGTGLFNLGSMSINLAIGAGSVSLVMPVVNIYVPLLLILSAWWLKERLTVRQIVGAGLVIACVAWLSLIS